MCHAILENRGSIKIEGGTKSDMGMDLAEGGGGGGFWSGRGV